MVASLQTHSSETVRSLNSFSSKAPRWRSRTSVMEDIKVRISILLLVMTSELPCFTRVLRFVDDFNGDHTSLQSPYIDLEDDICQKKFYKDGKET